MTSINEQLKRIYDSYLENLKMQIKQNPEEFSYPLFMKVFSDYEKVQKKILFVGKETYGWIDTMNHTNSLTTDYIMDCYEEFEFAKNYHGRNSPFWRFVKTFYQSINGHEIPNGFLWTNFSKCDTDGTTPNIKNQELNELGFNLIVDELKIVKPDIVLFLTGWTFEHHFQRVFNGINYITIEKDLIYQCLHPLLPKKTFMTMHPNGLNFRNKFTSTLEIIEKLCHDN
jgi:hypothetical protein